MPDWQNAELTVTNTTTNTDNSSRQLHIDWSSDSEFETEDTSYETRNRVFITMASANEFRDYLEDHSGTRSVTLRSTPSPVSDRYEVRWRQESRTELSRIEDFTGDETEDSREEEGSTEIIPELHECDLSDGLYSLEMFDSTFRGEKYVYFAPLDGTGSSNAKVNENLFNLLKNNSEKTVYIENNQIAGFKKEVK